MQIVTGELEGFTNEYPLSRLGNRNEILAVDIETTGLSPEKARIYLIGCAYWEEKRWKTIQWFDDDGNGEADILTSFILFAKRFRTLLHYNGDRFDLPFLTKRIIWNGLQGLPGAQNFPAGMRSADLYRYLKPYQKLLSLPDLRQQTVEKYLGTGRTEEESGGDLIKVYQQYLAVKEKGPAADSSSSQIVGKENLFSDEADEEKTPGDHETETTSEDDGSAPESNSLQEMRDSLLGHNAADIAGLIGISNVIAYQDLFSAKLNVYKAQANTYRNAEGEPVQELWMSARAADVPEDILKNPVTTNRDGCFLTITGNKITIKVPVYNGRAYYFYANYKDYYYLPELDQAIHKSIATFVDSRRREQATAQNCYTAKVGQFLPEWAQRGGTASHRDSGASSATVPYEPFFKRSYDDKTAWFTFTDEMKKDRKFFSDYATYVYRHVVSGS